MDEVPERRIVVGVHGSAGSLAALRWALREAGLRGTVLHVVRGWDPVLGRLAPYARYAHPPAAPEDRTTAASHLESAVRAMQDTLPAVSTMVEIIDGLAARVLLDQSTGAELLVLGSAAGGTSPDGIGPVARACLRHAPCPVVVVSDKRTHLPVPA